MKDQDPYEETWCWQHGVVMLFFSFDMEVGNIVAVKWKNV